MGKQTTGDQVASGGPRIVIGTGAGNKHPLRLLLMLAGIVVFAGGLGAGTRWYQQHHKQQEATKQTPVQKATTKAQDLAISGKFDESFKQIDDQLKRPDLTQGEKYALYFQQGITYENQEAYDKAMQSYVRAETFQKTRASAEAMARVATSLGDKKAAIAYYQSAIARIDPNSPTAQNAKDLYLQSIAALEAEAP